MIINKGLIISIISSMSIFISLIFIKEIDNKKKIENRVVIFLSISFIYMILISIIDLFINSLKYLQNKPFLDVFLYIMVNYTIIHIILNIGSKIKNNKVGDSKLYFIGIINLITLLIHNILEGIITYNISNNNLKLGIKISIGIILHNIPEGLAIIVPIYYSTKSKKRRVITLFIASLGELIGAIFSLFFFKNKLNNASIGYLMISISSIMILVSIEEIFFEIYTKNKKLLLIGNIVGLLLYLINILINHI